jgi:hypothetical protein
MLKLGGSSVSREVHPEHSEEIIAAEDRVSLWRGWNDRHVLSEGVTSPRQHGPQ